MCRKKISDEKGAANQKRLRTTDLMYHGLRKSIIIYKKYHALRLTFLFFYTVMRVSPQKIKIFGRKNKKLFESKDFS
jgi:hypothetical protein